MTTVATAVAAGAAQEAASHPRCGARGARHVGAAARAAVIAVIVGLGGTACAETQPDASLSLAASDAAAAGTQASYSITFTGAWTTAATPGGLPDNAHFSPLIGAVHNADVTFWEAGGKATPGIESMAERGRTATLTQEIEAAGANALSVISREGGPGATATVTIEPVTVTAGHPRVTLVSMIAPSPDWFVGVSGLSLLDAVGEWVETLTLDLVPWDAGTEEGDDFSFDNAATVPPGTIVILNGTGKFSDAPIATLTFTRLDGTGG